MAPIAAAVGFLVAVFILVINTLALIVFLKFRSLRTPSNICTASLAVGDLAIGVMLADMSVLMMVQEGFLNTHTCVVSQGVILMASQATGYEAILVSVDRFLAVSKPYFYEKHATNKRILVSVVVIWLLAALTSAALLVIRMQYHSSLTCVEWPREAVFVIMPAFYLSIPVCGVLYALVSRVALRHQRAIALQRVLVCAQHVPLRETFLQKMRATKLFVVVFGLFFAFKMPFATLLMMSTSMDIPVLLKQASVVLSCSNSCFNVFIYLFLNRDFRAAFKKLLRKN